MASHHVLAADNPLAITSGQRGFLFVLLALGILALAYAYVLVREVLRADQGTSKMQEISKAVQEGAAAYLNRQFRTLGVFSIIVFVLLMMNLQKQLLMMQRRQNPQPATTTAK